jgi:DNA-binding MarR family transcriptional regulator
MNTTDAARFLMLQLRDLERLVSLLGKRTLKPRDAGVVFALMCHTDTYSGRIFATAAQLAEDLQITESEARAAIGRLKKQHLLRQVADRMSGRKYYLLNPWVVQSGKPQAIGMAMKEFQAA